MDTVTLKLTKEQTGNINLLDAIPARLTNISEHNYGDGLKVAGRLSNMKVTVSERGIKIENSLTKYLLGNSIQVMRLADNKTVIEKLSDELHLPIQYANVTRLDFAKNITLMHEVKNYLPHLGDVSRYQRYPNKNGINYRQANREIVFYDKCLAMNIHREFIPPLYVGKNVLRIEKRYLNKVARYFNRPIITASDLYNEAFYMLVLDDWYNDYRRIDKLNNSIIDMSTVTTKRQLYSMGVLALVEMQGGEMAAIKNVQERQSKGELTKKQALDLRTAIKESRKLSIVSKDNELINELDEKVKEAVIYYR